MAEYIYTLQGMTKVHPPDKKVLEDVYLSFLPGAKIGVLGVNGSGKSSLLRIMAGQDKTFVGEAWARPSASVGYLPQEPDLGLGKTVMECVDDAVHEQRDALKRFEELSMKLGESLSDDEMNKVIEEHGKTQDQIEAADGWNLDHRLELAMDALRLPPPDADVGKLSGGEKRRVALCQILLRRPDLLLLDEPTNHLDAESVAWLEQHLAEYPGCIVAVTHDRYFLDNVAEWILELDRGHAFPFKGNYSSWLEQKRVRLEQEEKQESSRQRKLKHELDWVRAAPKARQAKGKARLRAYEELLNDAVASEARRERDLHPRRPAARRPRDRGRGAAEGVRRQAADRRPLVQDPEGRDRGHRWAERRRQDHAVSDDGGPGQARQGHSSARRHGQARVRRPEPRLALERQERLGRDQRRP